jgi:xanthine dehydrogenase YagR molybdenum-binding subunit
MARMTTLPRATGSALERVEGRAKVTGAAKYAYEWDAGDVAYAVPVTATIARGAVRSVEGALLWHANAPRLHDTGNGELALLQTPRVAYRGQVVALVAAGSLEEARAAAGAVRVEYDAEPHDVVLRADHPQLYAPDHVNPAYPTDTDDGDFDAAFAAAPVTVDRTYVTPATHNHPMEPHAALAVWDGDAVTLYETTQAPSRVRDSVARAFGLDRGAVRIVSPHVGGGFGSKLLARAPAILATMAARALGRPVKLALTRQQMFALAGYRTPTIQRVRLGASRDGGLMALSHEAVVQTSTLFEFAEQAAVQTRMMYAGAHRRTRHRVARLDVPTPTWMRAPGEAPGMFALESALDELAEAAGLDPVELRIRNEPELDPETGRPFSTRNLVACLRSGAERFGWAARAPRVDGRLRIGCGVAASTYPARRRPSRALARLEPDGTYYVAIGAADIGTGARTALTQIAADELDVGVERLRVEVGDSAFPDAQAAGGSMGTTSWGSAVVKACRALREQGGGEVTVDTAEDVERDAPLSKHAFGAQFAEVAVDLDSGEVRVPRLLGVFAVGRVINPATARSQLLGGMTMGLSMALLEESVMDRQFGDYANHDLAGYHVAVNADVRAIEAVWIDEDDPHASPMGAKGIGEIGIVGTAAAIANAVYAATGVRVRELPITLEKLL